jgi:hypothetical protein
VGGQTDSAAAGAGVAALLNQGTGERKSVECGQ